MRKPSTRWFGRGGRERRGVNTSTLNSERRSVSVWMGGAGGWRGLWVRHGRRQNEGWHKGRGGGVARSSIPRSTRPTPGKADTNTTASPAPPPPPAPLAACVPRPAAARGVSAGSTRVALPWTFENAKLSDPGLQPLLRYGEELTVGHAHIRLDLLRFKAALARLSVTHRGGVEVFSLAARLVLS